MAPVVVKALEAKGFLPYRQSYHWQNQWKHAVYHASIIVSEKFEGTYLSSANRLTRIEVALKVKRVGQPIPIFQTMPKARSTVPLPKLPLSLSNRLAMTGERTEELEKLLHDDARGQINERLARSLSNMPDCPSVWRGSPLVARSVYAVGTEGVLTTSKGTKGNLSTRLRSG